MRTLIEFRTLSEKLIIERANQNFQTKKEDRLLNLAAFKKDISSNSKLIKGKIHLEQTNDKNKINKTENT